MFFFRCGFLIVIIFFGKFALAAQASVPMLEFPEVPFSEITGQENTLEQIQRDIEFGAQAKGWSVINKQPNRIILRLSKTDWHVDVEVLYGPKKFAIKYLDSENLGYSKVGNLVLIHPNYNRWIPGLIKAISPSLNVRGGFVMPNSNVSLNQVQLVGDDKNFAFHYHRSRNDYSGWGLHVWGGLFEVMTSWFKPLEASGTDAFGVYFLVKSTQSDQMPEDAQGYFIVHQGESKDCGEDRNLDPQLGRDVFLVSGDCNIYYTVEDARKSKSYR